MKRRLCIDRLQHGRQLDSRAGAASMLPAPRSSRSEAAVCSATAGKRVLWLLRLPPPKP